MATKLLILSFPLLYTRALADLIPTAPGPGETFNAGGTCTIEWNADESGTWTNVSIDLKSGSNDNQSVVTNVVSGLDGTDASLSPYNWTCPEVAPYSAIYFYEFTNKGDQTTAQWTTRFTIASETGTSVPPPSSQQPNGDPIPWGTGQLAAGASAFTAQDSAGSAPDFQIDPMNLSRSKDRTDEKGDDSRHDGDSNNDEGDEEDDADTEDDEGDDDNWDDSGKDNGKDAKNNSDDSKDDEGEDGDREDDSGSGDTDSPQVHAKGADASSSASYPSTSSIAATSSTISSTFSQAATSVPNATSSTISSASSEPAPTAPAAATSPAKVVGPPKPPASSTATAGVNALPISASIPKPSAPAPKSSAYVSKPSPPVPKAGSSSVKSRPTAGAPTSQKKAHTSTAAVSAAAATPSSGSGQCECPAGTKGGLKTTSGSAEIQSISSWVLLPPLLVIFVVMF